MCMVNEFQAVISNIGTGFRSPMGLFPEGFDLTYYLSQKTKQRNTKRNKILNTEVKNTNTPHTQNQK